MAVVTEIGASHGLVVLSSWTALVVTVLAAYVALCRMLRHTRRDAEHSRRPYRNMEDFQKMSAEDAWEILKYVTSCEFPFTAKKALSFALFK